MGDSGNYIRYLLLKVCLRGEGLPSSSQRIICLEMIIIHPDGRGSYICLKSRKWKSRTTFASLAEPDLPISETEPLQP